MSGESILACRICMEPEDAVLAARSFAQLQNPLFWPGDAWPGLLLIEQASSICRRGGPFVVFPQLGLRALLMLLSNLCRRCQSISDCHTSLAQWQSGLGSG